MTGNAGSYFFFPFPMVNNNIILLIFKQPLFLRVSLVPLQSGRIQAGVFKYFIMFVHSTRKSVFSSLCIP